MNAEMDPAGPAGRTAATGASELAGITERLESLARELDSEPDDERAAELVREASELAAEAGREVDRALQAAAETREG
jgi:hypothetical protein